MSTFKQFAVQEWKEYLIPVGGPLVVFTGSYFVTNIGAQAFPVAMVVAGFMFGLKTLMLYNRWYIIEGTIRAIKAAGKVTVVKDDQ